LERYEKYELVLSQLPYISTTSVVKSKAKNKKGLKGGGGTVQQSSLSATYDFEDTFNKTVESLRN
jgi:hypothetical protein